MNLSELNEKYWPLWNSIRRSLSQFGKQFSLNPNLPFYHVLVQNPDRAFRRRPTELVLQTGNSDFQCIDWSHIEPTYLLHYDSQHYTPLIGLLKLVTKQKANLMRNHLWMKRASTSRNWIQGQSKTWRSDNAGDIHLAIFYFKSNTSLAGWTFRFIESAFFTPISTWMVKITVIASAVTGVLRLHVQAWEWVIQIIHSGGSWQRAWDLPIMKNLQSSSVLKMLLSICYLMVLLHQLEMRTIDSGSYHLWIKREPLFCTIIQCLIQNEHSLSLLCSPPLQYKDYFIMCPIKIAQYRQKLFKTVLPFVC